MDIKDIENIASHAVPRKKRLKGKRTMLWNTAGISLATVAVKLSALLPWGVGEVIAANQVEIIAALTGVINVYLRMDTDTAVGKSQ